MTKFTAAIKRFEEAKAVDTLEIAYKILYALEHGKKPEYKGQLISPQKLKVPEEKWLEVIESLLDEGYISGVRIYTDILGDTNVDISKARITLKGAAYLKENSVMAKFSKVATGVITIVKS